MKKTALGIFLVILAGFSPATFANEVVKTNGLETIKTTVDGNKTTTTKTSSVGFQGNDLYVDGVKIPSEYVDKEYVDLMKERATNLRKAKTSPLGSPQREAYEKKLAESNEKLSTYQEENSAKLDAYKNYATSTNEAKAQASSSSSSGGTTSPASSDSATNDTTTSSDSTTSGGAASTPSSGGTTSSDSATSGGTASTPSSGGTTSSDSATSDGATSTPSSDSATNDTTTSSNSGTNGGTTPTTSTSNSNTSTTTTPTTSNSTTNTSSSSIPTAGFNSGSSSSSMSGGGSADPVQERIRLISSLYYVLTVFAMFLGLVMMYQGAVKLKRRAENPNDARSFPGAILVTMFAGALAFNYSGSAGSMISSLLGEDNGYCFVLNDSMEESRDLHTDNCWDAENSEMVGDLADKVNEMESGKGDALKENAAVIVGLFQFIGLVYFLKGIYGLKLTSEGNGKDGYGKPIVTMILAALVIDLPHTLEMLRKTLELIGFGV